MPQSLSSVLIHLVFSTKHREPWIRENIESELHAYGSTVLRNLGCPALGMNGTADHLHSLFALSRVTTIMDVVEELKTSTSKWIKTKGEAFAGFHWQSGYSSFSVSQSNVEQAARSFQDEVRALLTRHGVAFDERCVCGIERGVRGPDRPVGAYGLKAARVPGALPSAVSGWAFGPRMYGLTQTRLYLYPVRPRTWHLSRHRPAAPPPSRQTGKWAIICGLQFATKN